jgi:hypothetical protein
MLWLRSSKLRLPNPESPIKETYMTSTNKFAFATLLSLVLFATACTTYVPVQQSQAPQYEYNPGYNPDNAVADAILMAAVLNGVNGYWGPGHVFYPSVMYGGVPGYYVGGVFHTSVQNRTVIVNHYNTGRTEFQRNPQAFAKTHPDAVAKPNFGSQAGGMTRGAATATSNTAPASNKPQFGQQQGGMTRGAATPAPSAKPAFGPQAGGMSRSASSASKSASSSGVGASRRR